MQDESGDEPAVERELLFALIDERRAALQKEAIALGEKLYEESAGEFVRRLKGYWSAARQGPK